MESERVMPEPFVNIETDSIKPNKRRRRKFPLVVAGVLGVLAILVVIASRDAFRPRAAQEQPHDDTLLPQAANAEKAAKEGPTPAADEEPFELVADDGQTLWASPTDGKAIDLAFLPPGCQVIVALRPAALLEHPQGKQVLDSLGPTGEEAIRKLEADTGIALRAMNRLVVGWYPESPSRWGVSYVIYPSQAETIDRVLAEHAQEGTTRAFSVYAPSERDEPRLVVATSKTLAEIRELEGTPPPLQHELEQLVASSDADRHFTMLLSTSILRADSRSIFTGVASRLREPVEDFLGDAVRAVSLSMHWRESFYGELGALATLDKKPARLALELSQKLDGFPAGVQEYLFRVDLQPYGRRLVARLPEMLRSLARYTRHGVEDEQAILNCYLPAAAGNNLIVAGELALVEPLRQQSRPQSEEPKQLTWRQMLAQKTSLSFPQDTLESALNVWSQETGIPMRIIGEDLQAEGITKNQSFGLSLYDRSAEEILLEILRLANPDKASTGLQDEKQKLVYVVKEGASDVKNTVVITTRTAAEERGDELPAAFRP